MRDTQNTLILVKYICVLAFDLTPICLQHPIPTQRRSPCHIRRGRHISGSSRCQLLKKRQPCIALRHVAAIEQNVAGGGQRFANARQLRQVIIEVITTEHRATQIQRALATVGYEVQRIYASAPMQESQHLVQAARLVI